jgi:hypothetical protein
MAMIYKSAIKRIEWHERVNFQKNDKVTTSCFTRTSKCHMSVLEELKSDLDSINEH